MLNDIESILVTPEEIEALCPLDIMRRAGLDVTTVGVGSDRICGAHGITVFTDTVDSDFKANDIEMIFLPGGMPGTLNLAACPAVADAIRAAVDYDSYIAAICAAPSILGDMGLLVGKRAVCYPGFEDRLTGAAVPDEKVVLDGNILTAKGMGAAVEMGLKIVEIFKGSTAAKELRHAIIAD